MEREPPYPRVVEPTQIKEPLDLTLSQDLMRLLAVLLCKRTIQKMIPNKQLTNSKEEGYKNQLTYKTISILLQVLTIAKCRPRNLNLLKGRFKLLKFRNVKMSKESSWTRFRRTSLSLTKMWTNRDTMTMRKNAKRKWSRSTKN
jgi:hypothetical protein